MTQICHKRELQHLANLEPIHLYWTYVSPKHCSPNLHLNLNFIMHTRYTYLIIRNTTILPHETRHYISHLHDIQENYCEYYIIRSIRLINIRLINRSRESAHYYQSMRKFPKTTMLSWGGISSSTRRASHELCFLLLSNSNLYQTTIHVDQQTVETKRC
jgi:hypothetical protein